jgi:hypothetical protein
LLRDAARESELENFCNGSMRRRLTHHEPCLVYAPFCGGRLIANREALRAVVRKWQKRGDIAAQAKPADVAKVILSLFLGFIVQSAMIGGICTH